MDEQPDALRVLAPPARTKPRRLRPWERPFLDSLSKRGVWQAACDDVGIARQTATGHAERHPDFAAAVVEAKDRACDLLEMEARRRAFEGLIRKKFNSKGEPLIDPETGEQYIEREYSDRLIELLLCAHRSKIFRHNATVETTGDVKIEINRGVAWKP